MSTHYGEHVLHSAENSLTTVRDALVMHNSNFKQPLKQISILIR